jgi:peroxiredoxin
MKAHILIGILLITTSCDSQKKNDGSWEVVIHGKVGSPQPGKITVQELNSDNTGAIDSFSLGKDNLFEKHLHLRGPGYYQLNFFNHQVVNLILYKSNVEVNVDGSNPQGFVEVKGSPEQDLVSKIQKMFAEGQQSPEMAALQTQYSEAAKAKDEKKMEALREQYLVISKKGNDKIAEELLKQPASLGVWEVLSHGNILDPEEYFRVYADAASKMTKEWPSSYFTKEFNETVRKMRVTAVGQVAPEIALTNPAGDTVKLSSLRGKYVLIDFWAKWCGPCRRENPNVVKAYHRFKDKGFEVYGVSLDRSKEDWVQAIQEDGLVWTQVSDLRYFECQAAKDYNVNAIPLSILLDKKGVIIAKNLRGPALEKKLAEILGNL